MDVTPLIPQGKKIINSYGDNGFNISGEKIKGSVIITPDKFYLCSNATTLPSLIECLNEFLYHDTTTEILLIGTGINHQFLEKDITKHLKKFCISADTMTTGAACRTYNVLLGEGRNIVAALIAV
jgi:uncharacterized protein